MDQGQTVYKGLAFVSTTCEPLHYVQQATVTGIEADGVQLVRVPGVSTRLEPIDGWRTDGREALLDALAQLDVVAAEFSAKLATEQAKIRQRIAELEGVQA